MNDTNSLDSDGNGLSERITDAARGLLYMSEVDAEIFPFTGSICDAVTKENLLSSIGAPAGSPVEERSVEDLFRPLKNGGDAARWQALQDLIVAELRDARVFKVGSIQLDVYVVGISSSGRLSGIKTFAVET